MKYIVLITSLVLFGMGCTPTPTPTTSDVTTTTNTESTIVDFETCAAAGNPIMESYPRQCRVGNVIYVEEIDIPLEDNSAVETIEEETETVEQEEVEPQVVQTPLSIPAVTGITLSGTATERGVSLSWEVNGIDTSKGIKVVRGTSPNPTYGIDYSFYLENGMVRSYTDPIVDGATYHYRVCTYTGDGCTNYSNDITITTEKKQTAEHTKSEQPSSTPEPSVSSIVLSSGNGNSINWQTTGDASMGFKIAYSINPNPVYPERDDEDNWIFVWDPAATSWELPAEQGSGFYFVRVCEYVGNACGVYSNEIKLYLEQ